MRKASLAQPHEQRKVEQLLKKLFRAKPISAKPAPISYGISALQAGIAGHRRVYDVENFPEALASVSFLDTVIHFPSFRSSVEKVGRDFPKRNKLPIFAVAFTFIAGIWLLSNPKLRECTSELRDSAFLAYSAGSVIVCAVFLCNSSLRL
jgi:hypothetical protein